MDDIPCGGWEANCSQCSCILTCGLPYTFMLHPILYHTVPWYIVFGPSSKCWQSILLPCCTILVYEGNTFCRAVCWCTMVVYLAWMFQVTAVFVFKIVFLFLFVFSVLLYYSIGCLALMLEVTAFPKPLLLARSAGNAVCWGCSAIPT